MKGQLSVSTPQEYLAAVETDRRADMTALDRLIRECDPGAERSIRMGILAYGTTPDGKWFRIGLASNKSYISLCVGGGREVP